MTPLAHALREAVYLTLLLAAPPVLAATVVGLLMSLLQSATRIEEPTLSTAPRLLAAVLALAFTGPWIFGELGRFTAAVLEAIPTLGKT